MDILFVQLPTSHLGSGERVFPLGLARLAALVPAGCHKHCLDMNLTQDPWLVLAEQLTAYPPAVAAFSFRNLDPLGGHTQSYYSGLACAARLTRRLAPRSRIVVGGPAFSMFAEPLMRRIPEIDAGLVGEGEGAFARLLTAAGPDADLPGVLWRQGDRLQGSQVGERIDLKSLRMPDYRSFDPRNYLSGNTYVAALGIEGKRGCDLGCSYCRYPFLGGARIRLRDPAQIVDDMAYLHAHYGADLFHFTDPVLNRPADHFEHLCRSIRQQKLSVRWTGFFREDQLTHDQAALARDAGLCAVYFSADALTDAGLTLLNKQLTKHQVLAAARITADLQLLTIHHFMVNLPGDQTRDRICESEHMLDELLAIHAPACNLGAVVFNPVRLYPQTPLTRRLVQTGELHPGQDLLAPIYYNPPEGAEIQLQLEARCQEAMILARAGSPACRAPIGGK